MRMREGTGEPNSTDSTLALPLPQLLKAPNEGKPEKTSEPQSLGTRCLALDKQDRPGGLHQQRY